MNSEADDRYRVAPDVLFQVVNDEMVLLDLDGETYFGLNPVGARIWQLLEQGRNTADIIATLLAEYEVGRDRLEEDVGALIEQLLTAGLIRP